MHSKASLNLTSKPIPIINGLMVIPLFCSVIAILHGSPPHASIPSVIKIMIFLQLLQAGKSLAHSSNDLAIGVVPFGFVILNLAFIFSALLAPKGTSSLVSLQS